jgi:DNA topoisomerase IA
MGQSLVIVESPTKAKTLSTYLGRNDQVWASVGHLKDLPKSKLGIDLEHNFDGSVGRPAWAAGWNRYRMAACDGWKK